MTQGTLTDKFSKHFGKKQLHIITVNYLTDHTRHDANSSSHCRDTAEYNDLTGEDDEHTNYGNEWMNIEGLTAINFGVEVIGDETASARNTREEVDQVAGQYIVQWLTR